MLPLTNHSSTQLDLFKYTEQPRLRAIVFLAEAVSLARMGMLPKTWEHPQATGISTDLTPKPSLKVVFPSNRNSFSNRTWALACALAKICLKGKWQVDFQRVRKYFGNYFFLFWELFFFYGFNWRWRRFD